MFKNYNKKVISRDSEKLEALLKEYKRIYQRMLEVSETLSTRTPTELITFANEIAEQKNTCNTHVLFSNYNADQNTDNLLHDELIEIIKKTQKLNTNLQTSIQTKLSLLKSELRELKLSQPAIASYSETLKEHKKEGIKRVC